METPNYEIDYNDERFTQVESEKQQALSGVDDTYNGMIDQSDQYYEAQINASQEWADKQSQLQQEQTDFTIEQIEQQKDQAHKDYLKEQSGAYADWRKQSDPHGVEAEKIAAAGLARTGFSESSQVSMHNTYQNRVAQAREVYNRAVLNYDNNIKDARLQNNAALAEISYNALQEQLKLSLEGFQYKNNLILQREDKKREVDNTYYNRYQNVLAQINHENAMAEDVRQFNANYELQSKQLDEQIRQFDKNYALEIQKFNESIRQFDAEIDRLKKKDAQEYAVQIKQLEEQRADRAEEKRQFEESQKLKREQLAEEKRQFDAQLAYNKSKSSGSSSGSSSKSSSGSSSSKSSSSGTKINKSNSSTQNKSSGNSNTEEDYPNDMDSILALGYGPISEAKLASLLDSGQVKRTLKNGKWYYVKNTASSAYNRMKNMGLSK